MLFRSVFETFLGKGKTNYLIKDKVIEVMPLAYMRGHSFEDTFVLFDEAQNATTVQMKMFLTRIGNNSTAVVNGDVTQRDIARAYGLEEAILKLDQVVGAETVEFSRSDIVRSGFVQDVIEAYDENIILEHKLDAIINGWKQNANIATL